MTNPATGHSEDVPTVDLSVPSKEQSPQPEETVEVTAVEESSADNPDLEGGESVEAAEPVEDYEEESPSEGEAPSMEWESEGENLVVERADATTTELVILSHIGEQSGLAVMQLDPADLRELYSQLGQVIEDQNYEMWVAYGNNPEDYRPAEQATLHSGQAEEGDDEEATPGRTRWQRVKDPVNVTSQLGFLDEPSPVSGLNWKQLVFIAFITLAIVSLVISGVM